MYQRLLSVVKNLITNGATPMLWGPPGVGKTSLAIQAGEELGLKTSVIETCLISPLDICIYVPNEKSGSLTEYVNEVISNSELLIIDDLAMGTAEQMKAVLKLTFEKRVGSKQIKNLKCVITSNDIHHRTDCSNVISTLLNRVVHLYFEKPSLDDWIDWASRRNDVNKSVIQFLLGHPYTFFEDVPEDENRKAWATPRSWHILGKSLDEGMSKETVTILANGTIGEKNSILFVNFWVYKRELDPEKILDMKNFTDEDPEKIFAYVMCATEHFIHRQDQRFVNFLERLRTSDFPEFVIASLRYVLRMCKDPKVINLLFKSEILTKLVKTII